MSNFILKVARRVGLLMVLPLAIVIVQGCVSMSSPAQIFLVRHAEKVDSSSDAVLSAIGRDRALELSKVLRDAGIEHIHSTNFARTRDTAGPLAERTGLGVEIYDHQDLPGLVSRVRQLGGRHLIVGHSNTTPEVVRLFGADAGVEINEESEFDRLYIVTVDQTGQVGATLLRYGNVRQ